MAGEPSITVTPNGPYLVNGAPLVARVREEDEDGETSWRTSGPLRESERYALCRCGESARKPICDGTHARIGFDGTETACGPGQPWPAIDPAVVEADAIPDEPDRPVQVAIVPDGPIHALGGLRITRSDGVELERRSWVALCRCGRSEHKPLCDGSHRTTGFRHTPEVGEASTASTAGAADSETRRASEVSGEAVTRR